MNDKKKFDIEEKINELIHLRNHMLVCMKVGNNPSADDYRKFSEINRSIIAEFEKPFWTRLPELPVVPEGESYIRVFVILYSRQYHELVTRSASYFIPNKQLNHKQGSFHVDNGEMYFDGDPDLKAWAYIDPRS